MKKTTLLSLAVASLSLTAAQAGTYVSGPSKAPVPPSEPLKVPSLCECFEPNTASVSLYVAGLLPDGSGDDAVGGGISLNYFFTEYVGLEVDYTAADTDHSATHLVTGSVVLRYPIKQICLAPYVFGGGGVHTNSETQGVWHAGVGVDYRISKCIGIFADGRYTWTEDTDDYTLVRAGVRFGF